MNSFWLMLCYVYKLETQKFPMISSVNRILGKAFQNFRITQDQAWSSFAEIQQQINNNNYLKRRIFYNNNK